MSSERMAFSKPGVFIDRGGDPEVAALRWATLVDDDKALKIKWADGAIEEFQLSSITQNPYTDTIIFESGGKRYAIRRLRESDGLWLSSLKIPVPMETLENIVKGKKMADESLTAFMLDDSPYVIGLVYSAPEGQFSRAEGDWVPMAASNESFVADNIYGVEIDPAKADDFVKLFDKNYVSVADLSQYESANSEPAEATEQSDE